MTLFGICVSLVCQFFGQRVVKTTELTLFSWLFRKLDWANEALDLIYFSRDTNKLGFSAFNKNEWQVFSPLPTTLSYPRAQDESDKEEFVPRGYIYVSFLAFSTGFAGCCWSALSTLGSHQSSCTRRTESPPLCCSHPTFVQKGSPQSLLPK